MHLSNTSTIKSFTVKVNLLVKLSVDTTNKGNVK